MYNEVFIFITFAAVATLNSCRICRNICAFIIISFVKTFPGTKQETSLLSRSLQCASFKCNWFQTTGTCSRLHCGRAGWLRYTAVETTALKNLSWQHSSQPSDPVARAHFCNQYLYSVHTTNSIQRRQFPPPPPPFLEEASFSLNEYGTQKTLKNKIPKFYTRNYTPWCKN
jgi:hypothetical protein